MAKKLCAVVLALMIMMMFSLEAFAGGTGSTTEPAISTGSQQGGNTSASAITGNSTNTTKSSVAVKKPDFDGFFENALKDGMAINSPQFILTITSPDKDKDSTYKKSYIISGNTEYSDVVITIAKYNEETKQYERMKNTDGESSWEVGDLRLFSKEIILTEGTNKIKIMAYRNTQKEEGLLDNIQQNCFTIELLDDSFFSRVIKKSKDIGADLSKGLDNLLNKNKTASTK